MIDIFVSLGVWNWVIIGCILLLLELIVPGVFLVWLGLAALITALISGLVGDHIGIGGWQGQIVLFLLFSVVLVLLGRRYFRTDPQSDEPLLNSRTEQLIGQIATLSEPIENGHGRVRINDTVWRVTGPDMAAGNKVRLARFQDGAFEVDILHR